MSYLQPLLVILSGGQVFDAILQEGDEPGVEAFIVAGKLENLSLDEFRISFGEKVDQALHPDLDFELTDFGLGFEV